MSSVAEKLYEALKDLKKPLQIDRFLRCETVLLNTYRFEKIKEVGGNYRYYLGFDDGTLMTVLVDDHQDIIEFEAYSLILKGRAKNEDERI